MHEMESHKESAFVTLTYNQENIPEGGTLEKAELQKFIKRVRKEKKLKYYACGEYGEKSKRPHYHLVMFGIGPRDRKLLEEKWDKGFIQIGTVTYESAAYTAGYIMKKYNGQKAREEYGDRQIPFQVCSQGLGKDYLDAHQDQILQDFRITIRGEPMALPRYYIKKMEGRIDQEKLNNAMNALAEERSKKHQERLKRRKISPAEEWSYDKKQRQQRALELKQKLEKGQKGKI